MWIANLLALMVMAVGADVPGGPSGGRALPSPTVLTWEQSEAVGNYNVTVRLGDASVPTVSHLKFGTQRVASPMIALSAGEFTNYTFTARVPGPCTTRPKDADTNRTLHLDLYVQGAGIKEQGASAADRSDSHTCSLLPAPCSFSPTVAPAPSSHTLYLCGDSTVTDQAGGIYASWGQVLPMMMEPGWAVANYARSGLALETFKKEGRLDRILENLKPGDWVAIQFGHNDQKRKGQEPENGYTDLLNEFCDRCEAKGAKMVIISPCERRRFDHGKQQPKTLAGYAAAAKAVAEKRHLPFIDLNDQTYRMNGVLGEKGTKSIYCFLAGKSDNTHHCLYGAYLNARIVAAGLAAIAVGADVPIPAEPARAAARPSGPPPAVKTEYRTFDCLNPPPDPHFPN